MVSLRRYLPGVASTAERARDQEIVPAIRARVAALADTNKYVMSGVATDVPLGKSKPRGGGLRGSE